MTPEERASRLQELRQLAAQDRLFANYPYEDAPTGDIRHVGLLIDHQLEVFELPDDAPVAAYVVQDANQNYNLGGALYYPGFYYLPGIDTEVIEGDRTRSVRLFKTVSHHPEGGFEFMAIVPADEEGNPLLRVLDFNAPPGTETLNALTQGSGILIYNDSLPAGFGDPVVDDRIDLHPYQIHFVDLCVNYGRLKIRQSRAEAEDLRRVAQDPSDAGLEKARALQESIRVMRAKATAYAELQSVRDLFAYISYLAWVFKWGSRLSGIGPVLELPTTAGRTVRDELSDLVVDSIPDLESRLVIDGQRLTIDQFLERLDKQLKEMQAGSPLLGRLTWDQIHERTDEQIRQEIVAMTDRILEHNRNAEEMTQLSAERIRTSLGANTPLPIPVLHIPQIVKPVKEVELLRMKIPGGGLYMLAVVFLEDNQATMPLVLAGIEIVLGFFCPPVGVLLGICSAVTSGQEANFKEALANADVNVDDTFVSMAEAREARIWATVEAVFSVIDVASEALKAVRAICRSTRRAAPKLGKATDEILQQKDVTDAITDIADDATDATEAFEELVPVADVAGKEQRVSNALDQTVDAKRAQQAAREARTAGVDMLDSPRVRPDTDVDAAMGDIRPDVREEIATHFDQIRDEYRQYFNKRRADIEGGAPHPQPRRFEKWAKNRYLELTPPPTPELPGRRATLLEIVAQKPKVRLRDVSVQDVKELLSDPQKLRQRLVERLKIKKSPLGARKTFTDRENKLIVDLKQAIDGGASDAHLDALIKGELLDPLRDTARRFGDTDLDFAIFVHGIKATEQWAPDSDAFRALKRLFDAPDIDNEVLRFILRSSEYRQFGGELISALERIRHVDGVFRPVADGGGQLGKNRSILQRLIDLDAGVAMETIALGRIMPQLPPGTKAIAGKELQSAWLRALQLEPGFSPDFTNKGFDRLLRIVAGKPGVETSLQDIRDLLQKSNRSKLLRRLVELVKSGNLSPGTKFTRIENEFITHLKQTIDAGASKDDLTELIEKELIKELRNKEGWAFKNLIDADIFLEYPDGKKLLVDTKYFNPDVPYDLTRARVLRDMQDGLEWQITKYALAIKEKLVGSAEIWISHHISHAADFDLDALRRLAERLAPDRIRIIAGVLEDPDFAQKFIQRSMLNPSNATPPRPPGGPQQPGVLHLDPQPTLPPPESQISVIPVPPPDPPPPIFESTRVARGATRVAIRLRHTQRDSEEHEIKILPKQDGVGQIVQGFGLYHAEPDDLLDGRPAQGIVRAPELRQEHLHAFQKALEAGELQPVNPRSGGTAREFVYTEPPALYLLAWKGAPSGTRTRVQIRRFEPNGVLVGEFPTSPAPLQKGWDCVPLFGEGRLYPMVPNAITTWALLVTGSKEAVLTLEVSAKGAVP